jgi:hypothetical protein
MKTPHAWLPEKARGWVTAFFAVLTLAITIALSSLGAQIKTGAAPHGIVSFEFAGSAVSSAEMMASWSDNQQSIARTIQSLDWLYLVAYPLFFSLLASALGRRLRGGWYRVSVWVAMGVLLCAPFDLVENLALNHQLENGASDGLAQLAFFCAIPKFALVGMAAIYVISAGSYWAVSGRKNTPVT